MLVHVFIFVLASMQPARTYIFFFWCFVAVGMSPLAAMFVKFMNQFLYSLSRRLRLEESLRDLYDFYPVVSVCVSILAWGLLLRKSNARKLALHVSLTLANGNYSFKC